MTTTDTRIANDRPAALTVIATIASTLDAWKRCQQTPGHDWTDRHAEALDHIERNYLPSGSGIDSGTKIDRDRSTPERIVLTTAYHHMNDGGYYDGWTEHTITVTASLYLGINLHITGRNRHDIKEYLGQTFDYALSQPYTPPATE